MFTRIAGLMVAAVAVVLMLVAPVQADPVVSVVDLGAMAGLGGTSASAYGVNTLGDVVGSYINGSGEEKAWIWHDANGDRLVETGERKNLGTLGGTQSCANSINDSGQITGWSYKTGMTNQIAFIYNDTNHNWIADAGEMTSLSTLGGVMSRGMRINNAGNVVGLSTAADGTIKAFKWKDADADKVWDAGEVANLGTLGGTNSRAFGINSLGHVVGYSNDGSAVQQTYKWVDANSNNAVDPGELNQVVSLATPSWGYDVNDAGQIGGFITAGDGQFHAFYFDGTTMTDINGLLGGTWSKAYSISESGVVCGAFEKTGVIHGFVYSSDTGQVWDVNTVMNAPVGFVVESVRDFQQMSPDEAVMVGYGTVNGETHAFVAYASEGAQAPEPMTMVLVGTGAMFLLGRARRKSC